MRETGTSGGAKGVRGRHEGLLCIPERRRLGQARRPPPPGVAGRGGGSRVITVTTREHPATQDPMELSHRHAQIGVLEHRAKRLFCDYTTWGGSAPPASSSSLATPAGRGRSPVSWSRLTSPTRARSSSSRPTRTTSARRYSASASLLTCSRRPSPDPTPASPGPRAPRGRGRSSPGRCLEPEEAREVCVLCYMKSTCVASATPGTPAGTASATAPTG